VFTAEVKMKFDGAFSTEEAKFELERRTISLTPPQKRLTVTAPPEESSRRSVG
jgi:hypothetical protein